MEHQTLQPQQCSRLISQKLVDFPHSWNTEEEKPRFMYKVKEILSEICLKLRPDLSIVDHLLRGLTLSIYSDTFIYITYQLHLKLSKSDIFIFVFSCFHIILPVLILVVSHTIKYTFEKAADNCSKGSKGLSGKYECCKIPAMLQHEKKENFSQNQQEELHKQSETFQDQKDFFFLG